MFQLIATVVGIALTALTVCATMYYCGTAFSNTIQKTDTIERIRFDQDSILDSEMILLSPSSKTVSEPTPVVVQQTVCVTAPPPIANNPYLSIFAILGGMAIAFVFGIGVGSSATRKQMESDSELSLLTK